MEIKMKTIIEPKSLSGTMELLPKYQILFEELKNKIENAYKSFGFLPLDTPSIESAQVLLAKAGGETEKQIYQFTKGDNDICLRFDLTVPLAKYVVANFNDLTFPFKRYQIGKVYRGEKAQKGRYREFYQCDIDTIGKDTLSLKNDAEYPAVIYSIFKSLDFGDFIIYLNNRKIVNGVLEELGLNLQKEDIMRLIDKFEKIGEENVRSSLKNDYNISEEVVEKLMNFILINGDTDAQLERLQSFNFTNETFKTGVEELIQVVKYVRMQNIPEKYFGIKLSIVRGLDYYTGTIYETFLTDYPKLGSVCSGGRFDNLAEFYTDKKLPGVGISIGLTRLFYQLCQNNLIKSEKCSISDVLILPMDENHIEKAYQVASMLRNNNINCQTYVENVKFKNKLAYCDKLSIPYAIIIGDDELNKGYITLKDMVKHEQQQILDKDIVASLNSLIK